MSFTTSAFILLSSAHTQDGLYVTLYNLTDSVLVRSFLLSIFILHSLLTSQALSLGIETLLSSALDIAI
jgi:hypothetical protein